MRDEDLMDGVARPGLWGLLQGGRWIRHMHLFETNAPGRNLLNNR
jgi:hypothetical protein